MSDGQDISDLFHCPLCAKRYSLDSRRPKVLDCGHTNCMECLTKWVKKAGQTCPKCRQTFKEAPFFLKDNFLILEYLEDSPGASSADYDDDISSERFCVNCQADASDICLLKEHQVCDKKELVLKQARDNKLQAHRQFRREEAMLQDMTDTLEKVKTAVTNKGGVTSRVHRELSELGNFKEALVKAEIRVQTMKESAFQDNDNIPKALDRFLQENSRRLFALEEQKRLLDMAKSCSITVTSEEAGLAWGTKVALGESSGPEERVLSYLVYLMLLNQQQRRLDTSQSAGAAAEGFAPSAPSLAGGCAAGEASARWASKTLLTSSIEDLIRDVERCVIEGNIPEVKEEASSDDDDSLSDTSSMVSEVASLPDTCQNDKKLFVTNIPELAKPEEIKSLFSKYGRVTFVRFLTKKPSDRKGRSSKKGEGRPRKIRAIVFVPDDFTVENILRNRPIVYQKRGQFERCLLDVKEFKDHKRSDKKSERRQQRRQRKLNKQNPSASVNQKGARQVNMESSESKSTEDMQAACRIYVNQVPSDISESQLRDIFSTHGTITGVKKIQHGQGQNKDVQMRPSGQRCYAFIEFADKESVSRVLNARPIKYYGKDFPGGCDLQVREFRQKPNPAAARPPHQAPQAAFPRHSHDPIAAAAAVGAAAGAAAAQAAVSVTQKWQQHGQQATAGVKQGAKGSQGNIPRGQALQQPSMQQQRQPMNQPQVLQQGQHQQQLYMSTQLHNQMYPQNHIYPQLPRQQQKEASPKGTIPKSKSAEDTCCVM